MLLALILSLLMSSVPALADSCCGSCMKGHVCNATKQEPAQLKAGQPQSRYPQLLVFVSFSMPMETLKILAAQVNAIGGAVVFRGLADGNFKDTALKLKELGQEALIDPTLFEAYTIQAVPTFVLRQKNTESAEEQVPYDLLSGNVSLIHALEQFATQGDVQKAAQSLLTELREKP